MRIHVAILVLLGVLVTAPALQADPIVIQSGGIASGITGLLVNGIEYDVTFRRGSYQEIFTTTPTFLVEYSTAVANGAPTHFVPPAVPMAALLIQAGITGVGDGTWTARSFDIPYTISPTGTIFAAHTTADPPQFVWIADGGAPSFPTLEGVRAYAVFQEKTSVPEPTTLWMLGLGLPALAIFFRHGRTKKTTREAAVV